MASIGTERAHRYTLLGCEGYSRILSGGRERGPHPILQGTHMAHTDTSRQSDEADAMRWGVVERLHDDVVLPTRATTGSAGCDLRAYLRERRVRCSNGLSQDERLADDLDGEWGVVLAPSEMALIPLGF